MKKITTLRTESVQRSWSIGMCFGSVDASVTLTQKCGDVEASVSVSTNIHMAHCGLSVDEAVHVISLAHDAIAWCLEEKEKFEKQLGV